MFSFFLPLPPPPHSHTHTTTTFFCLFTGHWSIIQVLSRKGIYVAETGDVVVTETVLMQTAPFRVVRVWGLLAAVVGCCHRVGM